MIKRSLLIFAGMVLFAATVLQAEEGVKAKSEAEINKESIAKCKATAKDGAPTPQKIMEKVNEGCELLAKEGLKAFVKFKGSDSPFFFNGAYIWIHDMKGVMRMHPIKYKLDGKPVLTLKDRKGKMLFLEMNKTAKANPNGGWVEYVWPKPGEKAASQKISFVKAVKVGNETLVVGCGVYDITKADVDKAMK